MIALALAALALAGDPSVQPWRIGPGSATSRLRRRPGLPRAGLSGRSAALPPDAATRSTSSSL